MRATRTSINTVRFDSANKSCLHILLIFTTALVAWSNIRRQCIDNYFFLGRKSSNGDVDDGFSVSKSPNIIMDSVLVHNNNHNNNRNKNGGASHTLGSKIALVDYCAGDSLDTIRSLVYYNRQAYARRHGYPIYSGSMEPLAIETFITPLAWIKAAYLHELLLLHSSSSSNNNNNNDKNNDDDKNYTEWLLWLDCDALVAKLDWSVEYVVKSLLQIDMKNTEYDMIMAEDPHVAFNSGVILMRCNGWMQNLWKRVLELARNESIRTHPWWEQKALLDLWEENKHEEQSRIFITPHRSVWNAFWTERRKDEYQHNKSFVWHRVNCRKIKECNEISTKFFCEIMPKGEYPEELCSNSHGMA